jgi:hypothetical protein
VTSFRGTFHNARLSLSSELRQIVIRNKLAPIVDVLMSPVVLVSALALKLVRRIGVSFMPVSRKIFIKVGVFPIEDHYYEPLFNPAHLNADFAKARELPAINWNIEGQFAFLNELAPFKTEVPTMPSTAVGGADADYWYCLIRLLKPRKIIEVGSGSSTRLAIKALAENRSECMHVCIEPYEQPWLEKSGATILRKRLEDVDMAIFRELQAGDILFIDSSHIIRPQGDVLTEVLEILPVLAPGVIVHFHDIFSPRHYHYKWVAEEVRLWNEQYLVEAFMSDNDRWEILGALNYLKNDHFDALKSVCPNLEADQKPGSFYIRRKC